MKEIDIKNRRCYYFDDIKRVRDIDFSDVLLGEKLYENIKFMIFHANLSWVQNHCIFGSKK